MGPRDRILMVFDEDYAKNSSAVYAAVRQVMEQTADCRRFMVFCQGRYRGPRLAMPGYKVSVRDHAAWRPGGWFARPGTVLRKLVHGDLDETHDRWASNISPADEALLRWLFDADRMRAVIVFTTNTGFALQVARLAHIFATSDVPHLIVVTVADAVAEYFLHDLRWLKARLLEDGRSDLAMRQPARRTEAGPFDSAGPLSFLDADAYPHQSNGSEPVVDWTDWIGAKLTLPRRVRDVILFIRPDWASCGSATTFRNLASYFRERDALMIDIAIWPYRIPFDEEQRRSNIDQEARDMKSALYFSVRGRLAASNLLRRLWDWPRFPPSNFTNQVLVQYALVANPLLMRTAVRRAKLSHIYLNHYFTYLFAKPLIAGRRFFLDTHDIQAINDVHSGRRNAITGRSEPFSRLLEREMRIAGRADRLCFVSLTEMELAAPHIRRDKLDHVIALPRVEACKPKPLGTPPRLLIVASDNAANQQALSWFLNRVWPRIVEDHAPLEAGKASVLLEVCGSIDRTFASMRWPGVTFHGVVAELYPHYEQADVVLLPVVSGGGIAIKTMEAVFHGRPVVATEHALRGLPRNIVETIGYWNSPNAFAGETLALLRSETKRTEQAERSLHAARLLRELEFDARLSAALDAVRIQADTDVVRQVPMLTTRAASGKGAASRDMLPIVTRATRIRPPG